MTIKNLIDCLVSDMLPCRVTGGERPPLEQLPPDIPPLIQNLITACWRQEANQRPSFPGIIKDDHARTFFRMRIAKRVALILLRRTWI